MGSAYAGSLKEFRYKVMRDLPNYTNNTFIFTTFLAERFQKDPI